jgi:hypothetical protein
VTGQIAGTAAVMMGDQRIVAEAQIKMKDAEFPLSAKLFELT